MLQIEKFKKKRAEEFLNEKNKMIEQNTKNLKEDLVSLDKITKTAY